MNIEDLKQEAAALGIKHHPNISADKLAAKIEEFYQAEEAKVEPIETVDDEEDALPEEEEVQVKQPQTKTNKKEAAVAPQKSLAKRLEEKARRFRIVTIIDNDNRVNNVTTTCIVNCSNEYFDLGTLVIPLNEKVEVRQGHVDVLRSIRMLQHVRDPKDPTMSMSVLRPRYTIQYEDRD